MPKFTKQDILHTLLEMLRDTPLDDVTVKDLTERCGISRQAFYYHFSDIYDVVSWGLQMELQALKARPGLATQAGRDEAVRDAMERMRANRSIVLNAYRAYERSYVEHYLKKWIGPVLSRQVEEDADGLQVTRDQIDFMVNLYTMGLLSVVLNWLDRGMPGHTMEHLDDFKTVMDGSVRLALERLEQKNKGGGSGRDLT